jgi:hypothetical protein
MSGKRPESKIIEEQEEEEEEEERKKKKKQQQLTGLCWMSDFHEDVCEEYGLLGSSSEIDRCYGRTYLKISRSNQTRSQLKYEASFAALDKVQSSCWYT